jgi:hypothetical protein
VHPSGVLLPAWTGCPGLASRFKDTDQGCSGLTADDCERDLHTTGFDQRLTGVDPAKVIRDWFV